MRMIPLKQGSSTIKRGQGVLPLALLTFPYNMIQILSLFFNSILFSLQCEQFEFRLHY
jgi:hypothetical protein